MKTYIQFVAATMLVVNLATLTACGGLTGGELSTNPNIANTATAQNLFVGTQVAVWNELGGDMSRVTSIWAQHLTGQLQQYANDNTYGLSEQTTNGFHQGLYITGGLGDIRNLQVAALALHDSLFLGIAQVQEAWMMGEGADLFGDLVYSQALMGITNPAVDDQRVVYAHVEALLDTAITNMSATGPSNVGPGDADLSSYSGDRTQWIDLAHTLKARFYMHQIHAPWTTPADMSALAIAEVPLGLKAGEDYNAQFSGAVNQQNFWYQFNIIAARSGYYSPSQTLIDTLKARGDSATLVASYFDNSLNNLSDARLQPNAPQTLASFVENELLWAEAAYRTGATADALTHLITARTAEGATNPAYTAVSTSPPVGQALLHAILDEKWIADFELGTEAWTDYRRTCTPNLAPTIANGKIPGRLFYDAGERQTNTNIPDAGQGINGAHNDGQPPLATSDGNGLACLAQ